MKRKNLLAKNFDHARINIKKISENSTLVAVSKRSPLEDILLAYDLGQRDFGENRVSELKEKSENVPSDVSWHFIGRMQRNKIKTLMKISGLKYIHSLDRLSVFEEMEKHTPQNKLRIFIQVNTSNESEKGGVSTEAELFELIAAIEKNPDFEMWGLMTMSSIRDDDLINSQKNSFSQLNDWKKKCESFCGHKLKLSMGMSNDYLVALEFGADYLRLGSCLFKNT